MSIGSFSGSTSPSPLRKSQYPSEALGLKSFLSEQPTISANNDTFAPKFGGPKSTGRSSSANIRKIARETGVDPEVLAEEVEAEKQGPGHHLSRAELRAIATTLGPAKP